MSIPPRAQRTAEYPRPDHFLVHLSDTHLIAGDGLLYDVVAAEAHLRQLLGELEASGSHPEGLIFTGDLADKGDPAAYARLRSIVDPIAARIGTRVIWVMGNHDNRAAFRSELLGQPPSMASIDRVHDFDGLRVIVLDSTVPGEHYGEISGAQLDWLAEELSSPAPHGSILAMHHPPVPCVLDLAVTVELRDQAGLAEVLEGSDVRAILAGHLHYSTSATFAGIPVSVASASCYTQDLNVQRGGSRAQDGAQALNLVHVYESTVLHSVVPIGSFATVSATSPGDVAATLRHAGIVIPPAAAKVPAPDEQLVLPSEPPTTPIGILAGV